MENLKSTPKDVFYHLLAIFSLYVSVISFLALTYAYISALFPDVLGPDYTWIWNQIRWSSSALIVVFAVFILMSWLIGKEIMAMPDKKELRIRRWLVYFTLFISAITIIVDLITLIYRFYSGDYTIQFFLKVLAVLAVAGAVFGYYLWDLRRDNTPSKKPKLYAWITSIIVLLAVVGGFFIVGSPATQRDRRFDETRINDLMTIQSEVVNYWTNKNKLPSVLNDLENSISDFILPTDPETQTAYSYLIKEPLVFDLCATFKTDSLIGQNRQMPAIYPIGGYQQNWNHGKGLVCFERKIDPQLYKNIKPLPL